MAQKSTSTTFPRSSVRSNGLPSTVVPLISSVWPTRSIPRDRFEPGGVRADFLVVALLQSGDQRAADLERPGPVADREIFGQHDRRLGLLDRRSRAGGQQVFQIDDQIVQLGRAGIDGSVEQPDSDGVVVGRGFSIFFAGDLAQFLAGGDHAGNGIAVVLAHGGRVLVPRLRQPLLVGFLDERDQILGVVGKRLARLFDHPSVVGGDRVLFGRGLLPGRFVADDHFLDDFAVGRPVRPPAARQAESQKCHGQDEMAGTHGHTPLRRVGGCLRPGLARCEACYGPWMHNSVARLRNRPHAGLAGARRRSRRALAWRAFLV